MTAAGDAGSVWVTLWPERWIAAIWARSADLQWQRQRRRTTASRLCRRTHRSVGPTAACTATQLGQGAGVRFLSIRAGMELMRWFKRTRPESRRAQEWRAACVSAADRPDERTLERLRRELETWGSNEEETEIERELLDALRELLDLTKFVADVGLPLLQTGHRVVGNDACHFSVSCSMPDEPGQPSGRLLLTAARAIFVGGPRGTTVPWHAVRDALHADRDLILIRADRDDLYRFRCNSFSDTFRGVFIARHLIASRKRAGPGL
jgi:hypothetical protein